MKRKKKLSPNIPHDILSTPYICEVSLEHGEMNVGNIRNGCVAIHKEKSRTVFTSVTMKWMEWFNYRVYLGAWIPG